MKRKIIKIDEKSCNGCGLCAKACHEGAIGMVAGKAKLLREDYCDGLGDCLPACPVNAITFEEREAPAYHEAAVLAAKQEKRPALKRLRNFPVQLKLVPPHANWFDEADLLIAADCCAYAYEDFHQDFLKNRVTLIGCPKLDGVDYSEKLAEIFKNGNIRSVTVVRMSVPCCGGISFAVNRALESCEKNIPCQVITIAPDGRVVL